MSLLSDEEAQGRKEPRYQPDAYAALTLGGGEGTASDFIRQCQT